MGMSLPRRWAAKAMKAAVIPLPQVATSGSEKFTPAFSNSARSVHDAVRTPRAKGTR